jgi:F1F0 ATPase subunit 2
MIETLTLFLSCAAGSALGTVFFGGLWWSVRKGLSSKQPALWFFASLLLRMSIALIGFYFVSASRLDRMAACLCGFIFARVAVVWMTRPGQFHLATEASHAP